MLWLNLNFRSCQLLVFAMISLKVGFYCYFSCRSFTNCDICVGLPVHKRVSHIEHNWPYFVGFGLPLALLTSLPSSFFVRLVMFHACVLTFLQFNCLVCIAARFCPLLYLCYCCLIK